jgi:hypothetical protein
MNLKACHLIRVYTDRDNTVFAGILFFKEGYSKNLTSGTENNKKTHFTPEVIA